MNITTSQTQNNLIETAIADYAQKGWLTFPLPHGDKCPPVRGLTGRNNPTPSSALISEEWEKAGYESNLGLVLKTSESSPFDLVGFDVDAYGDKPGAATWQDLLDEFPELDTLRSSRRGGDNVSGTRFYRVPKGADLRSPGAGIDLISRNHRYSVAYPSTISKDGLRYEWISPSGSLVEAPKVSDLPQLPTALVERLTAPSRAFVDASPVDLTEAIAWLEANTLHGFEICDENGHFLGATGSATFDALRDPELFSGDANTVLLPLVVRWVEAAVRDGAPNVVHALVALRELYIHALSTREVAARPEKTAWREWQHAVEWSVSEIRGEVDAGLYLPCVFEGGFNLNFEPIYQHLGIDPESVSKPSKVLEPIAGPYESVVARLEAYTAQLRPVDLRPMATFEAGQPEKAAPKKGLNLNPYSGIKRTRPSFLWEYEGIGAVPVGGMTIFTGKGGVGKSTACRWLAGELTQGTLPGKYFGKPQAVLYLAKEESAGAMVAPSLIANGADLDRVFQVELDGTTEDMRPERMAELTELCIEKGVRLVVVDPMSNYLNGANMNSSGEMRPVLEPWVKLAEDIGGSVVAIFHQNKSGGGDVTSGIGGAAAISEVSRSVFAFAKDDETGECVVSHSKHNLTPRPVPSLAYALGSVPVAVEDEDTGDEVLVDMGRFTVTGVSDVSAGDLQVKNKQVSQGEKQTAKTWLRDFLKANGPVLKSEVVEEAKGLFSESSIEKAARELKGLVKSTRERKAVWDL